MRKVNRDESSPRWGVQLAFCARKETLQQRKGTTRCKLANNTRTESIFQLGRARCCVGAGKRRVKTARVQRVSAGPMLTACAAGRCLECFEHHH